MSQDKAAASTRRFRATQIILVVMVAALLAGCGKKGNPVAPPPVTYPRHYPKQ